MEWTKEWTGTGSARSKVCSHGTVYNVSFIASTGQPDQGNMTYRCIINEGLQYLRHRSCLLETFTHSPLDLKLHLDV